MRIRWFAWLILIALMSACSSETGAPVEVVRIFVSATPAATRTAPPSSATPTATNTPTATLTPTPTAPAMAASGNPRAYTLFDPVPQSGAPCGWVDTLDFPLDPPDGQGARGGGDFGVYRDRYEKNHAGEDWGLNDRNNFGQPVYSIGHGQVTYAQPLGWGADKGVVIVRHNFPNGRPVLSFYGHLDPPSVTLQEGDCVQRGEVVGQIGRPRTSPHLHFEVRLHMPFAPGGGYWSSDPTSAGWLPPSDTISNYRLKVAPGARWVSDSIASTPLGSINETTFLIIQDDSLVGIDLLTGEALWSYELSAHIKDALLDRDDGLLYIADTVEGLVTFPLPVTGEGEDPRQTLEPLWEQKLPPSGRMDLMPLPGGGVLASFKDTMLAYSPEGDLLWREISDLTPNDWTLAEDSLLFATSDPETPLASADLEGVTAWEGDFSGRPMAAGGGAWLYDEEGLYLLDMADHTAQLVYLLPAGRMRQSTALPLSDGGILLLHSDHADRRLLAFNEKGALVWEFSVLLDGDPQLFELDGDIYVLSQPSFAGRRSYRSVEVFKVDPEGERMVRVFQSGSRTFNPQTSWAVDVNGRNLLIHVDGVGSLLLDPRAALDRMGQ